MFSEYVREKRQQEWQSTLSEADGLCFDLRDPTVARLEAVVWDLWWNTAAPFAHVAVIEPGEGPFPRNTGLALGGHVLVDRRLAATLELDALTFLIAHELAHIYLNHTLDELPNGRFFSWTAVRRSLARWRIERHQREYAADLLGHQWASRIGYPQGALRFFGPSVRENPDQKDSPSHPRPMRRLVTLGFDPWAVPARMAEPRPALIRDAAARTSRPPGPVRNPFPAMPPKWLRDAARESTKTPADGKTVL